MSVMSSLYNDKPGLFASVVVETLEMIQRQKRIDNDTANAVARGVNIMAVRDRSVARHYMEHHDVPAAVIERVLDRPAVRRMPSAEQLRSEAISPLTSCPADD